MHEIDTERLRLEPWAPRHEAMLARLAALPDVMRHVGPGVTWNAEEARQRHDRALAHWREHGFGWRAAVERRTGNAIGLIALNLAGPEIPELAPDDHEIGWWLDPGVWGKRYAGEGARAIVAEAFSRVGAPSVVARIKPCNEASLRVAAAAGLRTEAETIDRSGTPVRILRLHAPGSNPAAGAGSDRSRSARRAARG
jgi:RimJ/RimL family protein N-acetyltransferase